MKPQCLKILKQMLLKSKNNKTSHALKSYTDTYSVKNLNRFISEIQLKIVKFVIKNNVERGLEFAITFVLNQKKINEQR